MTSTADPGDFIYIHYSGHDTTIGPSSEYSNASTGDLALVLLEQTSATDIRYLRGLGLAYLLKTMVTNGLTVTLVLDCCFSGSVTRGDSSVRCLSYDPAIDAAYPPVPGQILSLEDEAGCLAHRSGSMNPNWLVNPDGYTILAACGSNEKAIELEFNGQRHEVLSYFLIKILEKLRDIRAKQRRIFAQLYSRFSKTQGDRPNK